METNLFPEIHPAAAVHPKAVLAPGVIIGPFSVVGEDVRIGQGTEVGAQVVLEGRVEIGERCKIYHGAIIGPPPQDLKYIQGTPSGVKIGHDTVIREYVTIHRSSKEDGWTVIGNENFVMAASHIAHDCQIGNGVIIVNYTGLSGHVEVGDYVVISGHSGVHPFTRVGTLAYIGGCSKVVQDVLPFVMVDGNPARARGVNVIGLRRRNVPAEVRQEIQRAFKILYRSRLSVSHAVERIRAELTPSELLDHFVEFVESSTRGIC
jgi:UDP-N-acetylglucosamine acyltransferase